MNPPNANPVQWQRLLTALRRRIWIVVPCVLIATLAAFVRAETEHPRYSATASLLFQQDELSQQLFGYSTTSIVDPTTEDATNVELVQLPYISLETAHALGLTHDQVVHAVTVAEVSSSDLVDVTATDVSPRRAARIANTYTSTFIAYRENAQRAQVIQAAGQLQTQISQLQKAHPGSDQLPNLITRLTQLKALVSLQTGDVQLAQPAQIPVNPSGPDVKKDTALGLLLGLIIGLLAAVAAERVDQTLRDPEEIREIFGLPILGTIPATRELSRAASSTDFSSNRDAEPFRLLRSQLRYFNVDREIKSILISSAAPGDGKSTIAWNLAKAAAVAATPGSVLLVDADLRAPTISSLADLGPGPGLAEVLTHGLRPSEVIKRLTISTTDQDGFYLDVLSSGGIVPNQSELMESNALRELVSELEHEYELIIFDAPPTSVVSDAIPLMPQVSGVLVVARLHQTRRAALRGLRDQISEINNVHILGLVLNGVRQKSLNYYSYGYGYGRAQKEPFGAIANESMTLMAPSHAAASDKEAQGPADRATTPKGTDSA